MKILITGGAGFIGSNLAQHFLTRGHTLTLFDALARRGAAQNLDWLNANFANQFRFVRGDIREPASLTGLVAGQDVIFHCAAQVAVTTSILEPRADFETNALGTLNLLEAVRLSGQRPVIFFTSTNKVYGTLDGAITVEQPTRHELLAYPAGIDETCRLDFHSPYGCSKGAADQYMHDYARIYEIPTVVFRMSCIYGTRQYGVEDQGWVAHFAIAAKRDKPLTIYGDGKQVRDLLFIDDLLRAFELALDHIKLTAGQIYNIGGGPANSVSIWAEFGPLLREFSGQDIAVSYRPWRQGDQLVYISNHAKATRDFGWTPQITPRIGIARLWDWVEHNSLLLQTF